jgi:hypothetical protein
VDISKNTQNKNNNLKKNLESELIDIINWKVPNIISLESKV